MTAPQDVLRYWFGELRDGWTVADRSALWFGADPRQDAEVVQRFGGEIARARSRELDHWQRDAGGVLALIILLDQMTRMVHRGSADAFSADRRALSLCQYGLARALDRGLAPVERMFFYLPLSHSEDLAHQDRCVQLHRRMRADAAPAVRAALSEPMAFAVKHREIIVRFARFPHRNAILGRQSTPDELAWLEESGERFGQVPRSGASGASG